MPLAPCRDCGENISNMARMCVRCGAPDPHRVEAKATLAVWFAVGIALFGLFLLVLWKTL